MPSDPSAPLGPEQLPGVLDAMAQGIQIIGFDDRYLYVNAAAARHGRFDRAALLGRTMTECYPGIETTEMFAVLRRCMTERTAAVFDNELTYPDGRAAHFELRFEPVPAGLCILSIDVTARKEAEAALQRSQERLEHSLGHAERALQREGGPTREDMQQVLTAARRSADLTRQLLAYGRRQVMHREVVGPNDRDAMPRGGRIAIDVSDVNLDAAYVRDHADAREAVETTAAIADAIASTPTDTHRKSEETILLAEDEPMLRALAEAVLTDEGYRVLATASGAEALEVCASHPEPIALLMTDMVMPGMSGPELLVRARELRPDLRVLGTSGYSEETLSQRGTLPAGLRVLEKPYAIEELLTAVRTALDTPRA